MKFGYQGGYLDGQPVHLHERSVRGVPLQQRRAEPDHRKHQLVPGSNSASDTTSFYAQEQRTIGRMTLQGAFAVRSRMELLPGGHRRPARFLPTPVDVCKDRRRQQRTSDISPRGGARHRRVRTTARRRSRSTSAKYLQAAQNGLSYGALRPTGRLHDHGRRGLGLIANSNYSPGLRPSESRSAQSTTTDFCGQISDSAFGQQEFTDTLDPMLINGWGVRPGDWQHRRIGAAGSAAARLGRNRLQPSLAHEFRRHRQYCCRRRRISGSSPSRRHSILGCRLKRRDGRFPVCITSTRTWHRPVSTVQSSRSPTAPIHKLRMVSCSNVSARPRSGLVFQGGVSTGNVRSNYCDIRAAIPEQNLIIGALTPTSIPTPTNPWCDTTASWVTRYTGLGRIPFQRSMCCSRGRSAATGRADRSELGNHASGCSSNLGADSTDTGPSAVEQRSQA